MATSFEIARREHQIVAEYAARGAALAEDIWRGIVGLDTTAAGAAEAMRDTVPERFATMLACDAVPAAYAFGLAVREFRGEMRTSLERRDAARRVWACFAEKADAVAEVERGFGWDMSAAWRSVQDVRGVSGDLEMVARVARLAGRMYGVLRGARATKVAGIAGEVYSVEQGNDVSRLLPAELALLTSPDLEPVILERLATRRAGQYAVRGEAMRSKGPLVVAIDESGSMHGARNEWAKAAAVAICRVAAEEGRPVAVVHFSTSAVAQDLRPSDPASVLKMIRTFLSGGTAIGLALGVAADTVARLAKKGHRGADVILVTDGVDGHAEAHTRAIDRLADEHQARLWTVAIECSIDEALPLRAKAAGYGELGREGLTDAGSVSLFAAAA